MADGIERDLLRDALTLSPSGQYASRAALVQMAEDAAKDLANLFTLLDTGPVDVLHPQTGVRIRVAAERPPRLAPRTEGSASETILLCPLPKSASLFIHDTLARTLDFDRVTICDHHFPSHVVPRLAPRLRYPGAVCHSHLSPAPRNLIFLNHWLTRLVVHVRDPRQVAVSARHHVARVHSEQGAFATLAAGRALPAGFFDRSEHDQMDFVIDHAMPEMIAWIDGWLDAAENPDFRPRILFTRFEDFREDNEGFVRNLAEWYGIDWQRCRYQPRTPREGQLHFRKGAAEEWREVLTPDQQARLNAMLGDRLLARFGWPAS